MTAKATTSKSVFTAFRCEKGLRAQVEEVAKANGESIGAFLSRMTANELMLLRLLGDNVKEYISEVAEHFKTTEDQKVPVALLLDLMAENYVALNEAEMEVFGDLTLLESHFVFDSKKHGEILTGDRLREHLKARYIEKLRLLQQHLQAAQKEFEGKNALEPTDSKTEKVTA